jgi:hypothetical protein
MEVRRKHAALMWAWRIPDAGRAADEVPPPWIVERLQSRDLIVNRFGGLTRQRPLSTEICFAGDYVILNQFDEIEFCRKELFPDHFEIVDMFEAN